jgi:hypothetical protein
LDFRSIWLACWDGTMRQSWLEREGLVERFNPLVILAMPTSV